MLAVACFIVYGCGDEPPTTYDRSTVDREYLFIAGVICPDADRNYKHEVFVGRVKPNDYPPVAPYSGDSILNRVLRSIRSCYAAEYVPITDAVVSILGPGGTRVTLASVGNGLYRDVANELHVTAGSKYQLDVEYDGDSYQGRTTIPGEIAMQNITDTMRIMKTTLPDRGRPDYVHFFEFNPSDRAVFYRCAVTQSWVDFIAVHHGMKQGEIGLVIPFQEFPVSERIAREHVVLEAIDSSYAPMYRPGSAYSGSDGWIDLFKSYDSLALSARSTIRGPGNVAGVFGSVNATTFEYIAIPGE